MADNNASGSEAWASPDGGPQGWASPEMAGDSAPSACRSRRADGKRPTLPVPLPAAPGRVPPPRVGVQRGRCVRALQAGNHRVEAAGLWADSRRRNQGASPQPQGHDRPQRRRHTRRPRSRCSGSATSTSARHLSFDPAQTSQAFTAGPIVSLVVGALVATLLLTMVTVISSVSVGRSVIGDVISPRDAWSRSLRRAADGDCHHLVDDARHRAGVRRDRRPRVRLLSCHAGAGGHRRNPRRTGLARLDGLARHQAVRDAARIGVGTARADRIDASLMAPDDGSLLDDLLRAAGGHHHHERHPERHVRAREFSLAAVSAQLRHSAYRPAPHPLRGRIVRWHAGIYGIRRVGDGGRLHRSADEARGI